MWVSIKLSCKKFMGFYNELFFANITFTMGLDSRLCNRVIVICFGEVYFIFLNLRNLPYIIREDPTSNVMSSSQAMIHLTLPKMSNFSD